MTRPADKLPRVTRYEGEEVYAPWCETCQSDHNTKWCKLPTDEQRAKALSYVSYEALCLCCADTLYQTQQDVARAREPGRLARRLAELRAGAST